MLKIQPKDVINPTAFKEVVLIDGVKSATIRVAEKGLVLAVRIGDEDRILGQHRGGPRYFRSFDAAASLLIQHGIYHWSADATGWRPKTLVRKWNDPLTDLENEHWET